MAWGRPEQMLAPALRAWTNPGLFRLLSVDTEDEEDDLPCLAWLDLPVLDLLPGAGGLFTPAKSVPRIRLIVPGLPACGVGSVSRFCAYGVDLREVINVYALSAWAMPE